MGRKMPRKPTTPFGHVAFGKDGGARKYVERLSSDKQGQEAEVGRRLAARLSELTGRHHIAVPCEENDHDFWINTSSSVVQVQATEVVSRDYLVPLTVDQFANGQHSYIETIFEGEGTIFGVDRSRKDRVLIEKLKRKLSKNYAKSSASLWLLIWTVRSDFMPFFTQAGSEEVGTSVTLLREWLDEFGCNPFDEIWFLHLETNPKRIWP